MSTHVAEVAREAFTVALEELATPTEQIFFDVGLTIDPDSRQFVFGMWMALWTGPETTVQVARHCNPADAGLPDFCRISAKMMIEELRIKRSSIEEEARNPQAYS